MSSIFRKYLCALSLFIISLSAHSTYAQTFDLMKFFDSEVASTQVKGDFAEYIVEQQKAAEGYLRIGHINEANGIDAIFVKRGLVEGEIEQCVLETKFNKSDLNPTTKQMTKEWILQRLKGEADSILKYKDRKFLQSLTRSTTKPPETSQFTRLITKDFEEILIFDDPKTGNPVYYHAGGDLKIGDISQAVTNTANIIKSFKKYYKAILARVMPNEKGELISVEQQLTTKAKPNPASEPVIRTVEPSLIERAFRFATLKRKVPELFLKFLKWFEPEKLKTETTDGSSKGPHDPIVGHTDIPNPDSTKSKSPGNSFGDKPISPKKRPWYHRLFRIRPTRLPKKI